MKIRQKIQVNEETILLQYKHGINCYMNVVTFDVVSSFSCKRSCKLGACTIATNNYIMGRQQRWDSGLMMIEQDSSYFHQSKSSTLMVDQGDTFSLVVVKHESAEVGVSRLDRVLVFGIHGNETLVGALEFADVAEALTEALLPTTDETLTSLALVEAHFVFGSRIRGILSTTQTQAAGIRDGCAVVEAGRKSGVGARAVRAVPAIVPPKIGLVGAVVGHAIVTEANEGIVLEGGIEISLRTSHHHRILFLLLLVKLLDDDIVDKKTVELHVFGIMNFVGRHDESRLNILHGFRVQLNHLIEFKGEHNGKVVEGFVSIGERYLHSGGDFLRGDGGILRGKNESRGCQEGNGSESEVGKVHGQWISSERRGGGKLFGCKELIL